MRRIIILGGVALALVYTCPSALHAEEATPAMDYESYQWEPGAEGMNDSPMATETNRAAGSDNGRKLRRRGKAKRKIGKNKKGAFQGGNMIARVRELDPALAAEMESLKDKVPPKVGRKVVMEVGKQMRMFMKESHGMGDSQKAREEIQDIVIMELKSLVASVKAQHGGKPLDAAGEATLRKNLESLFDRKVAMQERRMKTMETKLAELKKQIKERQSNKGEIVTQRLNQLLGKKKRFEW